MPQFVYHARNHTSHLIQGHVEAESERAALSLLAQEGVFPFQLREESAGLRAGRPRRRWRSHRRVSVRALATFTRQLANLLGAGLPLLNALHLLSEQTIAPFLRRVIADLELQVRGGTSLSDALSHHPQVFAPLYVNMVRAGELGGALEEVLNRLADFAEAADELRVKVQTALVYPAFLVGVGTVAVLVLLTWVIPKLLILFEESEQQLPVPTRLLLGISDLTVHYGWVLCLAVIGGVVWLRQMRQSSAGRVTLDRWLHRVPVIGELIQQVEVARTTRSLGMLIGNGAPLLEALDVVARGSTNTLLQRDLERVRDAVAGGSALAMAMSQGAYIPREVSNMVAVGEESGALENVLNKIATAHERLADRTTRLFTTLLEPILILMIGIVVGFIVMAMLLPIFQVEQLMR